MEIRRRWLAWHNNRYQEEVKGQSKKNLSLKDMYMKNIRERLEKHDRLLEKHDHHLEKHGHHLEKLDHSVQDIKESIMELKLEVEQGFHDIESKLRIASLISSQSSRQSYHNGSLGELCL